MSAASPLRGAASPGATRGPAPGVPRYAPGGRSARIRSAREDPIANAPVDSAALDAWLEAWQPEDTALQAARQRAAEVGCAPIDPLTGAVLRLLAAAVSARTVVEIGTGTGVAALWLLRGMAPDGVLTSVDSDGEHQRLARQSLAEAGIAPARARLITGRALEVLPRLSDAGYDLVLVDAGRGEHADYLEPALRLLRDGGVVAFTGALGSGRIADSSARDTEAVALRELAKAVRDDPRLVPAMLPLGPGLLAAVKRPAAS